MWICRLISLRIPSYLKNNDHPWGPLVILVRIRVARRDGDAVPQGVWLRTFGTWNKSCWSCRKREGITSLVCFNHRSTPPTIASGLEGIPPVSSVSSGGSRTVMDDRNTVYEGFFSIEASANRICQQKACRLCLGLLSQAQLWAERLTQSDMEGRKDGGGML